MKRRKLSTVSTMFQILIAVVLFVLLLLLIFWYQEGLNSYKPDEKTFYYLAGVKIECSEDAKFTATDKGVTVKDGAQESSMPKTPVMYDAENKIVLTSNNMLMRPAEMIDVYRINSFSEISEKNGMITIQNDGKSAKIDSGFLYDGVDTYTFLEKVTVEIGTKKIVLGPLSYAKVGYRNYIEYYNSSDEEFKRIGIADLDVVATLGNGDKLDLGRDLINHDNADALLFSAVDLLEVLDLK